jgi:uncharacterized protein YjiS (DUF1127 family)
MEMHSQRSLDEIHGISAPLRRQSRRGWIARRAITRLLAVLKRMKAAIRAELAARRAIEELAGMNDHMLRDLGITQGEIENAVRRPRVNVGTDEGPILSNDTGQNYPALPTISSPDLTIEGGLERDSALKAKIGAEKTPRDSDSESAPDAYVKGTLGRSSRRFSSASGDVPTHPAASAIAKGPI